MSSYLLLRAYTSVRWPAFRGINVMLSQGQVWKRFPPPSSDNRSRPRGAFEDDAHCTRMILGDFTLLKTTGSGNPGSRSVRASCRGNSHSYPGDECLNPLRKPAAAVAKLAPSENFPDSREKSQRSLLCLGSRSLRWMWRQWYPFSDQLWMGSCE